MIDARFHHLSLAVRSLDEGAAALKVMGLLPAPELPGAVEPESGVRVAFLRHPNGGPLVELVEGLDQASPVTGILKRAGAGPYHICFAVPVLETAGQELEAAGYHAITNPIHAVALSGARVQFFYHPACGLLELAEVNESK
jgi:hypothetical protein